MTIPQLPTLAEIGARLAASRPAVLPPDQRIRAVVAMVLREGNAGPELLFIERAAHDADPWAGNLGFPGGKAEAGDNDPQATAERETLEELGLDLTGASRLGRLGEIAGAHLPVRVACYLYGVAEPPPFILSAEVRDAFWVPLASLVDPARHGQATVRFAGSTLATPAIRLPVADKPVLWGLTYRLVMQFLDLVGLIPPSIPDKEIQP